MGRFQVRSALASDSIETSAAPASSPLSTSSSSSSTSTNSINAAPAFGKA
ncbi:unnamed protein product [Amoebophrya sp. A25]|nr:unnamed protein product [Amoebophrya sp. A25]|eukprot:GSA25T00011208001.1